MSSWFVKSILTAMLCSLAAIAANAQVGGRPAPPQRDDLPDFLRETLAKQRIARDKKDHEELVARSEEVTRLANELIENSSASVDAAGQRKRLELLEKAIKKIRGELGAEIDDADEDEPLPVGEKATLAAIRENAVRLTDEVKRSSRHSVSVGSIQTSNAIWRLLRVLRAKR